MSAVLAEVGGIRLFRNGFRVLPYGNPEDDWLGLDARSHQRSMLPPLGDKNWFGFATVHDPEGVWFNETSSRERLLEDERFKEVRGLFAKCLEVAAIRIAEARGKKTRAGTPRKKTSESLRELAEELREVEPEVRTFETTNPGLEDGERGASDQAAESANALPEREAIARELEKLAVALGTNKTALVRETERREASSK